MNVLNGGSIKPNVYQRKKGKKVGGKSSQLTHYLFVFHFCKSRQSQDIMLLCWSVQCLVCWYGFIYFASIIEMQVLVTDLGITLSLSLSLSLSHTHTHTHRHTHTHTHGKCRRVTDYLSFLLCQMRWSWCFHAWQVSVVPTMVVSIQE